MNYKFPLSLKQIKVEQRSKGIPPDYLYQLAFEKSLVANIIFVSDGSIVKVNSAACKLLGYTKKELLGKSRSSVFNLNETNYQLMPKQKAEEQDCIALGTAVKHNGKSFLCEIIYSFFLDENGIGNWFTIIADKSRIIFKQKNIVKKLKTVHDDIVVSDLKQNLTRRVKQKKASENIIQLMARADAKEAENKKSIKNLKERREAERLHIATQLRENVNQLLCASRLYANMAKSGGSNSDMFLSRSSQYTITAIEEIGKLTKLLTTDAVRDLQTPTPAESLDTASYQASKRHISNASDYLLENSINDKLKLSGKEAEEMGETFEIMANNIPHLAWIADEDGRITWFNSRWYEYTGTLSKKIEDSGLKYVVEPGKISEVADQWQRSINTGEPFELIFSIRGGDNLFRSFLNKGIPVRNDEGKIIRWFGTSTDITKQEELEQNNEQFLTMASYELKTPVTSIKLYGQIAESMLEIKGDANTLDIMKKMSSQVNKLTAVIEDIFEFQNTKGRINYNEAFF